MNQLLAFSGGKTINLMQYIAIGVIAAMIVTIVLISFYSKTFKTKALVDAALCISASFVLSFIKVPLGLFGGSVTLASFVPILIYAYAYGLAKGLLTGIIFGIINFIQSPYLLVPITFLLDYILGFASVGLMGLASKFSKSIMKNILIGTALVYIVRYIFHSLSGLVYFEYGIVAEGFPTSSALLYSMAYNAVYIFPDAIIVLVAFVLLLKTRNFQRLLGRLKG